jgi:hypothetical protein
MLVCTRVYISLFGVNKLTAFMYWVCEEWRDTYKVRVFMSDFIEAGCVVLFIKKQKHLFSRIRVTDTASELMRYACSS